MSHWNPIQQIEMEPKKKLNHDCYKKTDKFAVKWCLDCERCWQLYGAPTNRGAKKRFPDYLPDFPGRISCEDKVCPECNPDETEQKPYRKEYQKEYWKKQKGAK